jgi:hypothetical protein
MAAWSTDPKTGSQSRSVVSHLDLKAHAFSASENAQVSLLQPSCARTHLPNGHSAE